MASTGQRIGTAAGAGARLLCLLLVDRRQRFHRRPPLTTTETADQDPFHTTTWEREAGRAASHTGRAGRDRETHSPSISARPRGKLDMASSVTNYRFTFGPWNISTGADPFGPPVRAEVEFAAKIREYKKLGFGGVQFHDDDVCPAELSWEETRQAAAKVKKMLDGEGLFCEFIAPRLWEHPDTI